MANVSVAVVNIDELCINTIRTLAILVNLDFQALTNGGAKAYVGDFARHLKNSQQQ